MAITTPSPNAKDVVFLQRSNDNTYYKEVHISASSVILYIDESGSMNADKGSDFYSKFPPSASFTVSSSVASTASFIPGLYLNTDSVLITVANSDTVVIQRPTGSLNASFFDYVAMSGSNSKAGTIFGNWITNSIAYTQSITSNIGSTEQVTMSITLSNGSVRLIANASTTTNWLIKATGRYI